MTRRRYLLQWLRDIGIYRKLLLSRLRLITVLKDSGWERLWLLWRSINIAVNKIILHNLMLLLLLVGWRIAMNVWRRSLSVTHHLESVLRSHSERGLRSVLSHSILSAELSIIMRYSIVIRSNIAPLWSLSAVDSSTSLWRIITTGDVIVRSRRNRGHLMIGLRLVLGVLSWIVYNICVAAAGVHLEWFLLIGVRWLWVMRGSFYWVNHAMAQI